MKLSLQDKLLGQAGLALRICFADVVTTQPEQYPAKPHTSDYDAADQAHRAGLMRINHCGEICAQALYRGQALTCQDSEEVKVLIDAADEEDKHLKWCAFRLHQLGAKPTKLNPLAYSMCFSMGAMIGSFSPDTGRKFIAETESLVGEHLQKHLDQLDDPDSPDAQIIQQMVIDETQHQHEAEDRVETQEVNLPMGMRQGMRKIGELMSFFTYRI